MRIRLTFSKTEAMRFTGHLDLQRTLERTIRRANLPLAYSEGYHPHPKLALAAALPLGFTSTGEVADMWLKEDLELEEVETALREAAPPGVVINGIKEVEARAPKIQTLLESAEYIVTLPEPIPGLEQRVADLLAAEAMPYTRTRKRKSKDIDMRPLIEELAVEEPGEDGRPRLGMRLAAREGATGRPDEVLGVLGVKAATAAIERTDLLFAAE